MGGRPRRCGREDAPAGAARKEAGGQRQHNLEGDAFQERAPHTPEESEAARGSPDKGGQVVQVNALPEPLDDSER